MDKKLLGVCIALAAVLVLSTRFLPYLFAATEPGEAFPITLVGSDVAYDTLTNNHNDLKELGIMDPNATVWIEPTLTEDDLGEYLGTVGWSPEEELIGCAMYRWAAFPEARRVCILDLGGEYRLYQESGTYHAPNATGIPVAEVGEEVLSAPGILRKAVELTEDHREFWLDISGDGEEERLVMVRRNEVVYGETMDSGDLPYWFCDPLWVVTAEENGLCTVLEFPAAAFLAALEERLELERTGGQTVIRLGKHLTNPTAALEEDNAAPALETGLAYPCILDASKSGYIGFWSDLQVKTAQSIHTAGLFSGRVGYEDGVFTLSDWELSGAPMN